MPNHMTLLLCITSLAACSKLLRSIMEAQHVASLKTAAGSRIPVAVGLLKSGLVAATPGTPKFECDVYVWQLSGVRERVSSVMIRGLHKVLCYII